MLGDERSVFLTYPHLVIFPGLGIMLTVLSFNLLGDGLRDAHGAFVRFGAGRQQDHLVEGPGRHAGQPGRGPQDIWRHVLVPEVNATLQLRPKPLHEGLVGVAENAAELPGGEIEDSPTVRVDQIAAFTADDETVHEWLDQ